MQVASGILDSFVSIASDEMITGKPVKDVLMRIQPWMTAVAGAVMLLAYQSPLPAQSPDFSGADFYAPNGNSNGPAPYYAAGGPNFNPNSLYPPGAPAEYNPWPQISPFHPGNVGQDQVANQGGLWFRDVLYRQRTIVASLEAMAIFYAGPASANFGSPYAPRGGYGGLGTPAGSPVPPYAGLFPAVPSTTPPTQGWFPVSPDIFPYPALSATAGTYVIMDPRTYPIWDTSVLGSPSTEAGIKGNLGFFNEDDTGVVVTAWWGGKAYTDFTLGEEVINGIPVTQSLTTYLGGQNLTPRNGNIPLYNGEPGLTGFGNGSTAKYDVLYSVKTTAQAGGANMNLYKQAFYENGGVKVRPLWGLRYQYIGEGFHFRGIDSGFNYNITGLTATGGTGGTGGTNYTGRPVSTTLTRLYDQYTATLNSTVESHVAGPEIGLRIDLGEGRHGFKMWGETNLGLAVNSERIHLYGDNIGDPLFDTRVNLNPGSRMLNPNNVSEFDSIVNSAHVSPMFQQSVMANMDLLSVIPVVRDMTMFENATFRFGYTFTWVGEVSRPTQTVNWQGYPLYPEIKRYRSNWWANQLSFAFDWAY